MKNYADLGGEYLEHYGVKGMKWRRKKARNSQDPKPYDSEYEKEKNYNSKKNVYGSSNKKKSSNKSKSSLNFDLAKKQIATYKKANSRPKLGDNKVGMNVYGQVKDVFRALNTKKKKR